MVPSCQLPPPHAEPECVIAGEGELRHGERRRYIFSSGQMQELRDPPRQEPCLWSPSEVVLTPGFQHGTQAGLSLLPTVCGRQSDGPPKRSTSRSLEPVNTRPYKAKGLCRGG